MPPRVQHQRSTYTHISSHYKHSHTRILIFKLQIFNSSILLATYTTQSLHIISSEIPMTSSSVFLVICLLHSTIAILSGSLMMFNTQQIYTFNHGLDTTLKLLGSTPHDQLLIQTSDSFSGLLLFGIGLLLFMVGFVKDGEFQSFFAKGCVVLHVFMGLWRFWFERCVEDLKWDWARQCVGDVVLAFSWVFFLLSGWNDKYD